MKWIKDSWQTILYVISLTFIIFLVESSIYYFTFYNFWINYWIIIPILLFVASYLVKKFLKIKNFFEIELSNFFALILLFCNITNSKFGEWFKGNFQVVSFLIVALGILTIVVIKLNEKIGINKSHSNLSQNKLFNLFYLNTSKAHEIAMLIDNKIMKNIENEQVSETIFRNASSTSFGNKDVGYAGVDISSEEVSKQRVFESFDVKQTKSIVLRKIYEKISGNTKFVEGNIVLLENVELQQLNIDDTVMILNVLQDSKFKNQKNDDIEINLNKMMDKMLDDFTIDYTFNYPTSPTETKSCIIRLPYKSLTNFENGYLHNDLQLGKLSIIGIYRGKIDFSKKDSISSKFLELLSRSYEQQKNQEKPDIMKMSYTVVPDNEVEFDFKHKKLEDEFNLIDVIAIIQEINFEKEDE